MENVVLVIHLLLALALIAVVLLQRSEGGGLGIGGGGGATTGRAPLTGLGKLTWGFAIAFICTSIFLTVLAAQNASGTSVLDRLGGDGSAGEQPAPAGSTGGTGGLDLPLPPPPTLGDAPLTPPRAE